MFTPSVVLKRFTIFGLFGLMLFTGAPTTPARAEQPAAASRDDNGGGDDKNGDEDCWTKYKNHNGDDHDEDNHNGHGCHATTTTLVASPTTAFVGDVVKLTATVSANGDAGAGSVTFKEGNNVLGTVHLVNGVAILQTTTLSAGSHTIYAEFLGCRYDIISTSNNVTVQINTKPTQANTSTVLTVNPSSALVGAGVTFTATVSATSGTPNGTVTFTEGSTTLGTGSVSSGVATLVVSTLAIGSHTVVANYGGSSTFNSSVSNSVTVTITSPPKINDSAALTASPTSVFVGSNITFTATVSQSSGSVKPAGTVTFTEGSTTLGTGSLVNGAATLVTSALAVGSHTVVANYGGSSTFNTSVSNSVTVTVKASPPPKGNTTTSLSATPTSVSVGANIKFTATVTASGVCTLGGSVSFQDGAAIIGTATLSGGTAVLNTTALSIGTHNVIATYAGNDSCNSSASTAATAVTVNKGDTATTLAANPTSAEAGVNIKFTATVTTSGTCTLNGVVTFNDGGSIIGAALLVSDGTAVLNTTTLSVGTHSVTATYLGNDSCNSSASTAATAIALTISPAKGQSQTGIAALGASARWKDVITFTAEVQCDNNVVPTGNVSFIEDGNVIATEALTDGSAELNTSAFDLGTHHVSVSYVGDAKCLPSSSATLDIVVIRAISAITWLNPAAIPVNLALSGTQLNATANTPGTFVYSPAAGTFLPVGLNQTLSTAFTPNDSIHYENATAQVSIDVVDAAIPVVLSNAYCTQGGENLPVNTGYVGRLFTCIASAQDPTGGVLTYSWNFGDGTAGAQGASVPQTWTVAGTYLVSVTIANSFGGKIVEQFQVTVRGMTTDSDGDCFSDEIETALGSDPLNSASTPFGLACPAAGDPVGDRSLRIGLNFKTPGRDTIALNALIQLSNAFIPANQIVIIDIGGVVRAFKLDARGRGTLLAPTVTGKNREILRWSHRPNRTSVLFFQANKGAFSQFFTDEKLTNENTLRQLRTVPVEIIAEGKSFKVSISMMYSAVAGRSGVAASVRPGTAR